MIPNSNNTKLIKKNRGSLACPARFELTTPRLGMWRINHLTVDGLMDVKAFSKKWGVGVFVNYHTYSGAII